MRILVAPLNWGLGHATRCVPIVRYLVMQGHDVVLASDGAAHTFLCHYFPTLSCLEAPSLALHYSKHSYQVGAMLRQLPKLLTHARRDYVWLKQLLRHESFDYVISDNRFGMYSPRVKSVYITHQLMIKMPPYLRWMERLAHVLHKWVMSHYVECLVPDYAGESNLSGDLSHHYPLPSHARFIGPLSRFMGVSLPASDDSYNCVVLLSGIEPHRTLLEEKLLQQLAPSTEKVLLLEGRPGKSPLVKNSAHIKVCSHMSDEVLLPYLLGAKHIVCRSGYSTIMDLSILGILDKAHLIPTPGQTEQEYLATLHRGSHIKVL